jgi:DNA polymerase elongation subunit (family B)
MRIEGWLLDVSFTGDQVVLWIREPERGRVKLCDRYNPEFYAEPKDIEAEQLRRLLEEHDNIAEVALELRCSSIAYDAEIEVLRIRVDRMENYRRVLAQVDAFPYVAETYDGDLEHELKYLCDRRLIPMGRASIEADGSRLRSITPVPLGLEIKPPPFTLLPFGIKLRGDESTVIIFDENLEEHYVFAGPTKRVIRDFLDHFADVDPDIVACRDIDLQRLLALGRSHGLRRFDAVTPEGPTLWGGRAHVTLSTYGRLGLAGLVERVQYTRLPARLSAEWAAGRAIESRQCYEARSRGILLRNRGGFQPVMTLRELLCRDHGGLIFAPDVGLHENVAALDFESMFPNLIVRLNISYENIRGGRRRRGFIVDFTRETLERRLHFKHLRHKLPRNSQEYAWCEGRQLALKEILFCTYGYSGCWANRFGNMDTFMEVNRVARDHLVESMNVAREAGYRTLYGNNDSLFLHRPGATNEDYVALAEKITRNVGLPMAVENHFRFLVLLPQKGAPGTGAVNRYYGVTVNGNLVCRGIELRRRDTPQYVARVQREVIEALLGCDSLEEVRTEGVRRAIDVIEEACSRLQRGEVPPEEFRVSTVLRRSPWEYKARLPHVAAAEALGMAGERIEAGVLIDYVYVDASHRNPLRRVRPAGHGREIDVEKYVELVREAGRSILMPFEVDLGSRGPGHERLVRHLEEFS